MKQMQLPPAIAAKLASRFGAIRRVISVEGGMMNQAARMELEHQTLFVKWSESVPPGLYAAEVAGLDALRATEAFIIPDVVAHDETFLALQYLESESPEDENWARNFAEQLVALHRAPTAATFGWHAANFLGEFAQPNCETADWPVFYASHRLAPQLERARENGLLPAHREALLRRVIARISALCDDLEPRAALIHGDLWSGKFLNLSDGKIALFDPAVYRAPREIEMAYIELFDGFSAQLVPHYRELWPLPMGYEKRRDLWQLYYLLVHLNAFGETYGAPVEGACLATLK